MFVWACVPVSMLCMHVCIGKKLMSGIFLYHSSPYSEIKSDSEPGARHSSAMLAGELQGSTDLYLLPSLPSRPGIIASCPCAQLFILALEI